MKPNGPILVGVDCSEQSHTAATWATAEADLRHADLHLVVVNDQPTRDDEIWAMLQTLSNHLKTTYPRVEIHQRIARGHPADRLIRRSAKAQMIVVGARGRSPVTAALLGSVSTNVSMHSQCPVIVVREHRTSGPVAVGVDGSPHSETALRFALDTAAGHHTDLLAIQAWQDHTPDSTRSKPPPNTSQDSLAERQRELVNLLAGWENQYPDITMHHMVRHGHPVTELTKAAHGALILVVGHRGRGGFAGLPLGSVASGVLHHAPCPIAVVRNETQ